MCQLCLLSAGTGKYQCSGPAVYSLIHLAPAPALSHYQQWGLFSAVKSCEHNSLFPSSHCSLSLCFIFFSPFPPPHSSALTAPFKGQEARRRNPTKHDNLLDDDTRGSQPLPHYGDCDSFCWRAQVWQVWWGGLWLEPQIQNTKVLILFPFFFLLYLVTFCSYAHGTFLHHFPRMWRWSDQSGCTS